jgi:mannitol-1-phosphate/altronate dehydrogenase
LVVEDLASLLPHWILDVPHIIVRRVEGQLIGDAQLKLRCANATHTAVVYTMALSACTSIAAACAAYPHLLLFLDSLFHADIASLSHALSLPEAEVFDFYTEWRARVAAPSVDMSPFWVAQNAVTKVHATCNLCSRAHVGAFCCLV